MGWNLETHHYIPFKKNGGGGKSIWMITRFHWFFNFTGFPYSQIGFTNNLKFIPFNRALKDIVSKNIYPFLFAGTEVLRMTKCQEELAAALVFCSWQPRSSSMDWSPWSSTGSFNSDGRMARASHLPGEGQGGLLWRSSGTFTLSSWWLASSTAWDKVSPPPACQSVFIKHL